MLIRYFWVLISLFILAKFHYFDIILLHFVCENRILWHYHQVAHQHFRPWHQRANQDFPKIILLGMQFSVGIASLHRHPAAQQPKIASMHLLCFASFGHKGGHTARQKGDYTQQSRMEKFWPSFLSSNCSGWVAFTVIIGRNASPSLCLNFDGDSRAPH